MLIVASAAPAEAEGSFLPDGLFVSLGGGLVGTSLRDDDDRATGGIFSAKLGVPFVEVAAIEAQVDWIPDGDAYVVTVQERMPLLLDLGPVEPYVVAGIGWGEFGRSTQFALRAGGGIDFRVAENVAIGLDVTHVFLFEGVVDYTSFVFGARYGF